MALSCWLRGVGRLFEGVGLNGFGVSTAGVELAGVVISTACAELDAVVVPSVVVASPIPGASVNVGIGKVWEGDAAMRNWRSTLSSD